MVRDVERRIPPGGNAGDYTRSGNAYNVTRMDVRRVCPCAIKSMSGGAGILQPVGDSFLSAHQLKRIASFPDAFALTGRPVEKWARIGNSVPPLLMRSIARHVRALIAR